MSTNERTVRRLGWGVYVCVFFALLNVGFFVLNIVIRHWYMLPVSLAGVAMPTFAAIYTLSVRRRLS